MKIDAVKMEKIWSDYKLSGNYRSVARENGVSVYIAKKAVEKCEEKAKVSEGGAAEYMDNKRRDAFDFINKCMSIMSDDDKLEKASVNQIASAMGVVIEKFIKPTRDGGDGQLEEILKAVRKVE